MFARLLLLFTLVPLLELFLLLRIGGAIGPLPTLGLVVATVVAGSALARAQGLKVVREAQSSMNRGEMPSRAILEGVLVFAAGLMLVTPGVLTDVVGFLLLVPASRARIAERVGHAIRRRFVVETFGEVGFQERFERRGGAAPTDADVIDVEAEDADRASGEGNDVGDREPDDRRS